MTYRVEIADAARKTLAGLSTRDQKAIKSALDGLQANPRPMGSQKLVGQQGLMRIRKGNFRILYTVSDGEVLVLVLRIGDRKEVYRSLDRL
ncbi:MAG TPA: type II toxin-antitoxin system RelE/ParE family toxin [Holophagaceae bacterium]|nr:type II toxin-antitoxin system RelE/ParE family toxin [Holophagaceae bacterium]